MTIKANDYLNSTKFNNTGYKEFSINSYFSCKFQKKKKTRKNKKHPNF